jgi:hypothetical protein
MKCASYRSDQFYFCCKLLYIRNSWSVRFVISPQNGRPSQSSHGGNYRSGQQNSVIHQELLVRSLHNLATKWPALPEQPWRELQIWTAKQCYIFMLFSFPDFESKSVRFRTRKKEEKKKQMMRRRKGKWVGKYRIQKIRRNETEGGERGKKAKAKKCVTASHTRRTSYS